MIALAIIVLKNVIIAQLVMVIVIVAQLAILAGIAVGMWIPAIPYEYTKYTAIAIFLTTFETKISFNVTFLFISCLHNTKVIYL